MAKKNDEPDEQEHAEAEAVEEQPETAEEEEEVDGTVYHPAGTGHVLTDGQWVLPQTDEEEGGVE